MRTLLAFALILCPVAAGGQSLHGQWIVEAPELPDYSATLLVDRQSRAAWDSRTIKTIGYVAKADSDRATIFLTNKTKVFHLHCSRIVDQMACYSFLPDGISTLFRLTRVGPGPATLRPSRPD